MELVRTVKFLSDCGVGFEVQDWGEKLSDWVTSTPASFATAGKQPPCLPTAASNSYPSDLTVV